MKVKKLKLTAVFITAVILSATAFAQTAQRINFARGKSSANINGTVGRNGKKEYVLRGKKGQELWANLMSECESLSFDVIDNGTGESLTEPVTDFRDELPGTDDYIIRVQNTDLPNCKYSLKVSIK